MLSYIQTYAQIDLKIDANTLLNKEVDLSESQMKFWQHLDYIEDSIPGTSLMKAYKELDIEHKGKPVIVALLDTKIDIEHEDLKNRFHKNKGEIIGNTIDDDQNGYVDDYMGWDFLSNKSGEYIKYQHREVVRYIKYLEASNDVDSSRYTDAMKILQSEKDRCSRLIKRFEHYENDFTTYSAIAKKYLADQSLSKQNIDSLLTKIAHNEDAVQLKKLATLLGYGLTMKNIPSIKLDFQEQLNKSLNKDYDERSLIGDQSDNISDTQYGSNDVSGEVPFNHATPVAGIIAAERGNDIGIDGISNQIQILPVVMVSSGDEFDKDVATAIRYAADNGASVINMSWGKKKSLHSDWVQEAMIYASKKDVLLVTSAGNSGINTDIEKYYPTDSKNGEEILDNLLVVGASSFQSDTFLKAAFSNYGKKTVDIFAPGISIYSLAPNNGYAFGGGTSIAAPIVSGIAGLLRSLYPSLSAIQVKKILMKSATKFDIEVNLDINKKTENKASFTNMSSSGGIINAYHAILLAGLFTNTNSGSFKKD